MLPLPASWDSGFCCARLYLRNCRVGTGQRNSGSGRSFPGLLAVVFFPRLRLKFRFTSPWRWEYTRSCSTLPRVGLALGNRFEVATYELIGVAGPSYLI